MKPWFKQGTPWIWLNAGAVSLSLIMVVGLLSLIAIRGLSHFWPSAIVQADVTVADGTRTRVLGSLVRSEILTAAEIRETGVDVPDGYDVVTRFLFKQGNRDIYGRDFIWHSELGMGEWSYPVQVMAVERREWGNFYGFPVAIREQGELVARGDQLWPELQARIARANRIWDEVHRIERRDIGAINLVLERIRLDRRRADLRGIAGAERDALEVEWGTTTERLQREFGELQARLDALRRDAQRDVLVAELVDGRQVDINVGNIVRAIQPNAIGIFAKLRYYFERFWEFMTGYPREANTEGGIFPAIFGTVTMVMIMSVIVSPLGVLAAIYLREYARQGPLLRVIRISVYNLAGVPSIVFGVFGLGFFVYFLGGNIDRLFYPEGLPAPTFGTPGLFWASLTLALLTLPVVIVATEEGLARIPRTIRDGSLALGATKAETLWKVVVPLATPAMMTGLILAIARAAGEVAPLMLVGVVKLAPSLPIDSVPPFVHLERKIMHLGFHIYDVGFQSPNVEAARPLVYATALILVMIIIVLNLTAVGIRNHLREKYKSEGD
jgi:phosphate transport system permease protein